MEKKEYCLSEVLALVEREYTERYVSVSDIFLFSS